MKIIEYPDQLDFLDAFWIEPVNVDLVEGFYRYKISDDGGHELDFSFNSIAGSFEVILSFKGVQLINLTFECVSYIKIRETSKGKGIDVGFVIKGADAHIEITLKPDLFVSWSILEVLDL